MDSATLPVDVKCPVDSCEYHPNVSDATLAATLLTIHAQSQHVAMPTPSHAAGATAKVEKISRPTVDEVYPWRTGYTSSSDGKNTKTLRESPAST